MSLLFVALMLGGAPSLAASFTAEFNPDTITVGETTTLSLVFEGGQPTGLPQLSVANLRINYVGTASEYTVVNGQTTSTLRYNYSVTALKEGEYTLPALRAVVGGQTLSSQPVKLKVLKRGQSGSSATGTPDVAFLKLLTPRTTCYLGEIFPVEVRLCVHRAVRGENVQMPQLAAEGFTLGQMNQPLQTRTTIGQNVYQLLVFKTTATPIRTGDLTLGPAECSLTLGYPVQRRRPNRDPFNFGFDMFDFFGEQLDWRPVTLLSETNLLRVLPLPTNDLPASFSGAIGQFQVNYSVAPTNVAVGDPIQVKVEITGQGALDTIKLPPQPAWREFKAYPPTSKVETTDALGLEGTKTFEQTLVAESTQVKEVPAFTFSFFDPTAGQYVTVTKPPVPLLIRPSAATVQPIVQLNPSATPPENASQIQDIIHIKQRLGTVSAIQAPLALRPWFLLLQSVPLLVWLGMLVWRKRSDSLARNPRLRRQRQASRVVREGLEQLRQLAASHQAETFYAVVFRLLQEQLGERLDLPSSAITEAVIDERLQPLGAADQTLRELHGLFQMCNQVKYAPQAVPRELGGVLATVETTLRELQRIKT